MRLIIHLLSAVIVTSCASEPLYVQDFDKATALPAELMLNGNYSLQSEGTGKALALDMQPLETYNLLFGPSRKEPTMVSARIRAESRKRLAPAFGVGLNGVSGVSIRVSPAKDQIELLLGDTVLTHQPFVWKSGTWTWFRLRLQLVDATWQAQGRVWQAETEEPKDWSITSILESAPPSGRATAWGIPYGGNPILFDDLRVEAAP